MSKRMKGIGYPRPRVESRTYRTWSRPFANLCRMQLLWVHMGAYWWIVPVGSAVQLPRYFRRSPRVFDLGLPHQATSRTFLSLVFCTCWLISSLVRCWVSLWPDDLKSLGQTFGFLPGLRTFTTPGSPNQWSPLPSKYGRWQLWLT